MEKNTAIVLAAGRGKRMQSKVAKQFMELEGRPLLCYALDAFEGCSLIDEVVLVTNAEAVDYCAGEIVAAGGYRKVAQIVAGGAERYDSVRAGLNAAEGADYVYIHDGARPFVTDDILERLHDTVLATGACVAAMQVKDTIKIADADGYCEETPDRSRLWQIQTPQVFRYREIKDAYEAMFREGRFDVTDDATVMERYGKLRVKMCPASYQNIKITTPEDLPIASAFLREKNS